EGNAEGREIARADQIHVAARLRSGGWHRLSFHDETLAPFKSIEGQGVGKRSLLDAGYGAETRLQAFVESHESLVLGVFRLRQGEPGGQQADGVPAVVMREEPVEATQEEAGARQQHKGESH